MFLQYNYNWWHLYNFSTSAYIIIILNVLIPNTECRCWEKLSGTSHTDASKTVDFQWDYRAGVDLPTLNYLSTVRERQLMGIAQADVPSRCSVLDWAVPEKSCGSPGWWNSVCPLNVTGNPDIHSHSFVRRPSFFLSSEDGKKNQHLHWRISFWVSERTFLTSGKRTFWYNYICSWLMILLYVFPSSLAI